MYYKLFKYFILYVSVIILFLLYVSFLSNVAIAHIRQSKCGILYFGLPAALRPLHHTETLLSRHFRRCSNASYILVPIYRILGRQL